eukprot:12141453-Heterocapsa_arctica.AAC.1
MLTHAQPCGSREPDRLCDIGHLKEKWFALYVAGALAGSGGAVKMMVEKEGMFKRLDLEVRANARAVLEVEVLRRGASLEPESSTSTSWVAT